MTFVYETLYNRDKSKNVRVWWMERDGAKHRVFSGVQGGAITATGWTEEKGNRQRPDPVEQAIFQVESNYRYQLARTYFTSIEEYDRDGPRFFEPQLAKSWKDQGWDKALKRVAKERKDASPLVGTGIFEEAKLDGFCSITQTDRMTSREGQSITAVPHILSALTRFQAEFPDARLHGELYNHDYADDFERLSGILKKENPTPAEIEEVSKLQLHVYDYCSPDIVAAGLGYEARRDLLEADLGPFIAAGGAIVIHPYTKVKDEADLEEKRKGHVLRRFEGQMVKLDIPYEPGTRSWGSNKHKVEEEGEFKIVRIRDGKGNYTGYAKAVDLVDSEGREFSAGIAGGICDATKALMESDHHWVTITYLRLTKRGVPKGGVAKAWWGPEGRTI